MVINVIGGLIHQYDVQHVQVFTLDATMLSTFTATDNIGGYSNSDVTVQQSYNYIYL